MEDGDFILVKLEGRSRKRRKVLRTSVNSIQSGSNRPRPDMDLLTLEQLENRISEAKKKIPEGFINHVTESLAEIVGDRRITKIRSIGLGNFSSHRSSLAQLVLLEAIKNRFDVSVASSQDPVTSVVEQAYLEKRGFDVLPATYCLEQQLESPDVEEVTLLFMIHCEGYLYNNIISTYWSSLHMLKNMILIGNCCSALVSESSQIIPQAMPFVRAFASVCGKSVKVRFEGDPYAFSGTSIQFVERVIETLPVCIGDNRTLHWQK